MIIPLGTYSDYDDMTLLLRGKEWRTWVNHIKDLRITRVEKAIAQIRDGNLSEAQKYVAIIDDIDKQISMFKNKKVELENELNKEE